MTGHTDSSWIDHFAFAPQCDLTIEEGLPSVNRTCDVVSITGLCVTLFFRDLQMDLVRLYSFAGWTRYTAGLNLELIAPRSTHFAHKEC